MPLRVRCRCGQELIVRHSEWVYFCLVLMMAAVLVNTTALVLLVFHRQGDEASAAEVPPRSAERDETGDETGDQAKASARVPARSPGALEKGPGALEKGAVPAPSEEAPPPADTLTADADIADPPDIPFPSDTSDPSAIPPPPDASRPLESIAGLPKQALTPRAGSGRAVERLLEQLELLHPASSESTPRAPEASPVPPPRMLYPGPKLLRLLLLGEAGEDLEIVCAALADPDPLIRMAALDRALAALASPPAAAERRRLGPLVGAARGHLETVADGRRLLKLLQLPRGERVPELRDERWSEISGRARRLVEGLTGRGALVERLASFAKQGADVLLAVDTTRSMDGALEPVKETAAWLLPTLEWAVPGARVGLLTFKDDVEEIVALSPRPSRDVLPRILALEARGGGDVPEGVYSALRAALELGRVAWRPEAIRHIVIIGDQPPRYEEKRAFESLASACHRQGGFSIHLLGVNADEGSGGVPFFADFAAAGGGRSATCRRETFGLEALACLFGSRSRPVAEKLPRLLQRLFTSR